MPDGADAVRARAAARKDALLAEIRRRLEALDPVLWSATGVQITVRFRPGGEIRSVVVEPEFRYEPGG